MIVTRIVETTIDLTQPGSEILSGNIDAVVMKKLTQRYVGHCYQSMLVLEIVKINKRSDVVMCRTQLNGAAYVDVNCTVSGMVLVPGEILQDCRIIEILGDNIIAQHAGKNVVKIDTQKNTLALQVLKTGQSIPVVVQQARYTPNSTQITAVATLYAPIADPLIMYQVTEGLTADERQRVEQLLAEIAEEEKHIDHSAQNYKFFTNIMYPYVTTQKFESMPMYKKFAPLAFDAAQLDRVTHGTVTYPSIDKRENRRLLWSEENIEFDEITIVKSSAYVAIAEILNRYLKYLITLRGFMETYKTPEDIRPNITYWKVCQQLKK